jgi:cytochrome c-type biogenesis protein CcmI
MELGLGGLVVLAVLAFVLLPLVRRTTRPTITAAPESSAVERAEIYRELVELELDQRIGKISEADYRAVCESLLERAASLISEDDLPASDVDRQIEREIASARAEIRGSADRPTEEARS